MINLKELYTRIVETTGLEVVTLDSLKTAVANCMADLTSRGYRTFKEMHIADCIDKDANKEYTINGNMLTFKVPKDLRKIIYLRLFFPNGAVIARRYSLSNKRVGCKFINGAFRSMIEPGQAIFYVKGDLVCVEWHGNCGESILDFCFGYYQKLSLPGNFPTNSEVEEALINETMDECKIDIRDEFVDALVFYAAYFYYARYIKDTEKVQHYLSQYKYYVEDITHELAYEDEFNEEDAVIKLEEDY